MREDLPRARSGATEPATAEPTTDEPATTEPTTEPTTDEPVEATIAREDLPRGRAGAGEAATDVEDAPFDMRDALGTAVAEPDSAGAETPEGAWWTRDPRAAAIIAAILAVALLVATFFAGGALLGPGPEGPFTAPSGQAPVEPVAGWTQQADWISPELATAGQGAPPARVDGRIITTATTTSGPALVAIRAEDGTREWVTPIEGDLTGPPTVITRGDEPAVVAATDHSLIVWPGSGAAGDPPAPRTWDFTEAGLELVPGSPVPLLANTETLTARVLVDDRLERVTLRSGTTPITAREDGTVISVGPDGHWVAQSPGEDPSEATLLQPPAFGALVDAVLGTAGSTLVVSWTHDDERSYLAGYDTGAMELQWKTSVRGHPTREAFHASPDGEWAVVGSTALDLGTGEGERLPRGWETIAVTNERAWSSEDVVTRGGKVSPLDEAVADIAGVPVMVTADGLGIVLATDGDAARMYALRPDDGADAEQPA